MSLGICPCLHVCVCPFTYPHGECVCASMCVFLYGHMYVNTYPCVYVCVCVHFWCVHVYMLLCCTSVCACVHTCVYGCFYVSVCLICVLTCVFTCFLIVCVCPCIYGAEHSMCPFVGYVPMCLCVCAFVYVFVLLIYGVSEEIRWEGEVNIERYIQSLAQRVKNFIRQASNSSCRY